MTRPAAFRFAPIGYVQSPFREKFGIPRQPGLVPAARGVLELLPPWNRPELVQGLEDFSHVWLIFVFHGVPAGAWHPTVRPPRLGGNRRIGVFASRSMFRPNPIGQSLLKLERIEHTGGSVRLHLAGLDLLDGTPVLDIKPYLPYVEAIPQARAGYAAEAPAAKREVRFSATARAVLQTQATRYPELQTLIAQVLALDPRPAYVVETQQDSGRRYGMRLLEFDVQWQMQGRTVQVQHIVTPATAASGGATPDRP